MANKPRLIRSVALDTTIREDLMAKLTAHLHSEAEQRIPKGAFKAFFEEAIVRFFSEAHLDLAPYGLPLGSVVSGAPETIRQLTQVLQGNKP